MPDLYAINLFLQERLEREWRKEIRAPEAALCLAEAGLLDNEKNGLPLRELLRDGRIAGQEQRPDTKNGEWRIRRRAESRDARAIQLARQRMRSYLPIDQALLREDWPLSTNCPDFWSELG